MNEQKTDYEVDERKTVAEAPNLRVRQLTLSGTQVVPWHLHTIITDTFFCMDGPMVVRTREPEAAHTLQPGQTLAVDPGIAHHVSRVDGGRSKFMIVQGVGQYDYVPVD